MEILCFFAGIAYAYTQSFFALLFLIIALFLKAPKVIIFWFSIAYFWGMVHQYWVADQGMPIEAVIQKAAIEGTIISIPTNNANKTQFQFNIYSLNKKPVNAKVNLACYTNCPNFQAGQRWKFIAKLKKPVNLGNPGSFNYHQHLLAQHIQWTGYIIPKTAILLSEHSSEKLLIIRNSFGKRLEEHQVSSKILGVLEALTLGITTHINKEQWELFRRTGTTHLMVISGAHIGLVAGLIYGISYWLWLRIPRLCLYKPASQIASIAGLLAASVYAILAGFAIPAQRSLMACAVLSLCHFTNRKFTGWQAWRYGLLIVLIFEPHAIFLPGFYLSFLAVAILIITSKRVGGGRIKKTIALQVACLVGLMPFTLFWFSYGAWNGVLANLVAIPLVGYLIVPLSLVNLLLAQFVINTDIIKPVSWLIELLLWYLQKIDSLSMINFTFKLPHIASLISLTLSLSIFFLIPNKQLFTSASILLVSSLFPNYLRVKEGEVRMDVLDVGQGLAIAVNTKNHTLIYDTGMKFFQGGDMAQLAIIPYLNYFGLKKIDRIVISHPDLDHRGGLSSLEENFKVQELLVDDVDFYQRGKSCHNYPSWEWDGVYFQFLPIQENFVKKNDRSCVLKITNKSESILLTGDIEKNAEKYLVERYKDLLNSEFLLVAHHGSKTSSSNDFIHQVNPRYALISAGFDNRYRFPHKETLDTLTSYNISVFNTIDCGMMTVNLKGDGRNHEPLCFNFTKNRVY